MKSVVNRKYFPILGAVCLFSSVGFTQDLVALREATYSAERMQLLEGEALRDGRQSQMLSGEQKRQMVLASKSGRTEGKLSFSSAFQTIPLVENSLENGIWTKTYMSVTNVTSKSFTVYATLHTELGAYKTAQFDLKALETRSWADLVGSQGFQVEGKGALELDGWFDPPGGTSDNNFVVHAGLYRIFPGFGLVYTTLSVQGSLDSVGGSYDGYITGIPNNRWRKTSIGAYNAGATTLLATVTYIDSSGGTVETEPLIVSAGAWREIALKKDLSVGCVKLSSGGSLYAYAVTTDTNTGDMNFQAASSFIP